MTGTAQRTSRSPDILTCIANLSNDAVFTSPELANQMIDLLERAWAEAHGGAIIWQNSNVKFLDPFTKSGVFLREIVRRLVGGLATQIPDLQERVDHVLTKQVFGIATETLTAHLSRRTVYCSKRATGKHSITQAFENPAGNIWFERTEHTWNKRQKIQRVNPLTAVTEIVEDIGTGKCRYCGASEAEYGRGEELESHAYAFIHADNIEARLGELFGDNMRFDVIIGNPPYQLSDGGHGTSAAPIYQLFVEKALGLDPRFAVFVTPSRWFAGGKGLDEYRKRMLSDHRMRELVDYPKLYEVFGGVKIRGGVSYFLWDRDYDGPCTVQTMWDGKPFGTPSARYLDAYDVLVRWNKAVPILEKVLSRHEPALDKRVSSRKPFGLPTNFKGRDDSRGMSDPIKLLANQRIAWIERADIANNPEWLDDWKVLMTAVQGTSAAVETKFLSKPIMAGPGTACTETYLVAGRFDNEITAAYYSAYLRTRFVRFLVSLRKSTQHATRDVYSFVPDVPLDREWTDEMLYERYELTDEEIEFIESQVVAHEQNPIDDLVDEAING